MKFRRTAAILGMLSALLAVSHGDRAHAQEIAYRPLLLTLPANTQAMAMGDAFQFNGRISDLVFYNPALMDLARGIEGGAHRWGTRTTSFTLSGATGWLGGGAGIGLQSLSYAVNTAELFSGPSPPGGGRGTHQDLLLAGGNLPVSELVATGGVAKRVWGLRFGLTLKLIDQRIGPERDGTAALALGVAWVGDLVTLGLSARNLGPDLTIQGRDYPLPQRFVLGGATQNAPVGPLDLSATAALTLDHHDRWIPAVGAQAEWWPVVGRTFIARAGWRRVPIGEAWPVTVGLGFTGDQLGLDYAYQGFGDVDADLKGAHRLSVRWR